MRGAMARADREVTFRERSAGQTAFGVKKNPTATYLPALPRSSGANTYALFCDLANDIPPAQNNQAGG